MKWLMTRLKTVCKGFVDGFTVKRVLSAKLCADKPTPSRRNGPLGSCQANDDLPMIGVL